ncbi:MAG: geranylgeranyl reductase family protein [Prochloron sp. SP5CPC1]|nr:geranylgeranyl reductase family protein [Candidatus Paraprochloron terpiosi SP5CPC1]
MFDCIIVGAGPAGATAAYHLAKKGHSVMVLEAVSFTRYKPCGGGVSPAVGQWFDFDFTPAIDNTIPKVKYTWKLGDPVTIERLDVDGVWMVRRETFDSFLMERAQEAGAELKDKTEVTGIQLTGDTWQVKTKDGSYTGSYLIAADGGPMASWLGLNQPKPFLGATLEVKAAMTEAAQETASFDFGSFKNGYIWNFPKSDGYSISGAFFRGKGKPQELKKQLHNYGSKLGVDLSNSEYREHSINLWTENLTLHGQRAVLVGDGAAVADPLTGEGIRPAIFTGVKAAQAIGAALAGEKDALAGYTQAIATEWGKDMALAQKLAGLFFQFPGIAYKVAVKKPAAAQIMSKILCGQLHYYDVTEKAITRIKSSLIPGRRG